MSKHNLSAQEFAALLKWKMCSDPWPTDHTAKKYVEDMLNAEAQSRNYDGWAHAYHEFGLDEYLD